MNSLPLHPAVVHLPIALALLMPVFAAGFAWALWTGRIGPRGWLVVVALQAVLVGSALAAINTGGAEEDRVERIVRKSAIHQHEEFAEQFAWAGAAALALAALVLVKGRPAVARGAAAAVVVAAVVVAALGIRVGHAGGQLVYTHGAAAAYASPQQSRLAPERGSTRQSPNEDGSRSRP